MNLSAEQQWRLRQGEQTCGHSRGKERAGWIESVAWEHIYALVSSVRVVSNSLRPCDLQHARPPCPSPTPGVCSNSCPLSRWCHPSYPLSSSSPPAFFPNLSHYQGLFKWVSSSHQGAKVLEFQLQHQSFQWTLNTQDSFRMDWLDLLAVQGTLKSLLQHHSPKTSILQRSAFFIVQLSHPYMTTGQTTALTSCDSFMKLKRMYP